MQQLLYNHLYMQADVIVIGAGAAGLMAAAELAAAEKKVVVLEAKEQAGGRICTVADDAFEQPVEGGAEFVHGALPLTQQLLQKAGLKAVASGGDIWRSEKGKFKKQEDFIEEYDALMAALKSLEHDVTVTNFLQAHFSLPRHRQLHQTLKSYVEGYYAGDMERASAFALREELEGAEDEDKRIVGGYVGLIHYLQQQCKAAGVQFYFGTHVTTIQWQKGEVTVTAESGQQYKAQKVIVTVSVGMLQQEKIAFEPAIKNKTAATQQLGFGGVVKVLLQLKEPFWKKDFGMEKMAFLFSGEQIPTWWTQHPQQSNLLTGWCAGPAAVALKEETDEALFEKAVTSLANCFALSVAAIKEKTSAWKVFNWPADKYTGGGYSYLTVESKQAIKELTTPVESTLYFAGEGLHFGMEIGTVEAALQSGKSVVQKVLASV